MSFFTKEGVGWLALVCLLLAVEVFGGVPMFVEYALVLITVLYTGWYLKRCYNEALQQHPEVFLETFSKMNK